MTALEMRWHLIKGADGRPCLNIQWESAQPDFVRGFARTQIHRSARRIYGNSPILSDVLHNGRSGGQNR